MTPAITSAGWLSDPEHERPRQIVGPDRVAREPLYFLMYAVFPKPSHPDYGRVDGAYVSLFVREPIQAAAESVAQALIDQEGWEVEELDEAYPAHAGMYPPEHPSRERFEQAQLDGVVATFYRWPVGAPEDE